MTYIIQLLKSIYQRISTFVDPRYRKIIKWLRHFAPEKSTRKGSSWGIMISIALILGYAATRILRLGHGIFPDVLVGVLLALVSFGLMVLGSYIILGLLKKLPRTFTSVLLAAFSVLTIYIGSFPGISILIPIGVIAIGSFIGGGITLIINGGFKASSLLKKIGISSLIAISMTAIVLGFIWYSNRGTAENLININLDDLTSPITLDLSDPSSKGSFTVKSLTYGSGDDRREEFDTGASLLTKRVNGRPFLVKLKGWKGKLRNRYWGFDRSELPLNGRVWYPEEKGPFPLVLIVHGNHSMRDYSDPGYEYLGEFFASKGYIVVSVDENFINGDWSVNYSKESDCRGWLLLEHLSVWREWEKNSSNPFYQKVDMERISLIGHSRGGEAVCIAAAFNKLEHYPDDARVKFDYQFNIKSLISIAQVDGQYKPADQSTPLENIDYLLLHGSHDGDVSNFSGDRQYKRIKFTNDDFHFKTSIYIYRANHGQFNTEWGDSDWGGIMNKALNRKELISGEEQRKIGKIYLGSFLDVTLKGHSEFIPLFEDYRKGLNWLPDTYYINRFKDSKTKYFCDFDEDINPTTMSYENGSIEGGYLSDWQEKDLGFRSGGIRQNQVVKLGWKYENLASESSQKDSMSISTDSLIIVDTAFFALNIPILFIDSAHVDSSDFLTFSIAQLDGKPSKALELDKSDKVLKEEAEEKKKKDKAEKKAQKKKDTNKEKKSNKKDKKEKADDSDENGEERNPLSFTVILSDDAGVSFSFDINECAWILPPFKAKFTRLKAYEKWYKKSSEPTLQTVFIPMKFIRERKPTFNLNGLRRIEFRFDKIKSGVIFLDEIGIKKNIDK